MNARTEGFTNPLRRMLGRLCECVPFSVAEGLYVLAALGFLAFLVLVCAPSRAAGTEAAQSTRSCLGLGTRF